MADHNPRDASTRSNPTHNRGFQEDFCIRDRMQQPMIPGRLGFDTLPPLRTPPHSQQPNHQFTFSHPLGDRLASKAENHTLQRPTYMATSPRSTDSASSSTSVNWSSSKPAEPATRTRIFDPARDLNPTQPPRSGKSPTTSPQSCSSRSELASRAFSPTEQYATSQASPVAGTSSVSTPTAQVSGYDNRFKLDVVEHPVCARASTFGDRDRRVINPPPILKLTLKNYNPSDPEDVKRLTWSYNIVTCTLWRLPYLEAPESEWVESTEWHPNSRRQQGGLMGSLVANPFIAESPNDGFDEDSGGPLACFYVFSDLSCRTIGLYRLRFALTRLGEDFYRQVGALSPTIAHAWTEPFEVFSAKDFPGVRPSSRLVRYLKVKGANVTIKKEKEGASPESARKRSRVPTITGGLSPVAVTADTKRSRPVTESQTGYRDQGQTGSGYSDGNGAND